MSLLDGLLLVSVVAVFATLFFSNNQQIGRLVMVLLLLQLLLLMLMAPIVYHADSITMITASLHFSVFGQVLEWQYTALSWFFACITLFMAVICAWYASAEWGQYYLAHAHSLRAFYVALVVNVLSMLLLLGSGDLLSFFIGWEMVSWASFLMLLVGGESSRQQALKYLVYAMVGAMSMLAGMVWLYVNTGSLAYDAINQMLVGDYHYNAWLLLLLFGSGFSIKMGLLPVHLWQAPAYAETPGPGAAFMGAISSRMGLFAIILVLLQFIGIARISGLEIPYTSLSARDLLAWIAAFTIIIPTFTALRQTDARYLLAWHGIGQGGYMLLGLVIGSSLSSAGGLMHIFNHATYQSLLFLSVTAVIYRTGTSDLNQLGGLVTRMPLSFVAMLVGIIGLAGLPPMNGFVSKWLIYKALIQEGQPLLFVAAVIGTLGTILSVYKLIHNTFLGQLRLEHQKLQEVPWSMSIPMLLLAAIVFITGYFPGLILAWVSAVQGVVGLPVLDYTLGGVTLAHGSLNMVVIVSVLLAGCALGAFIFYILGGPSKRVSQLDNYAGGHFLTAQTRYQYSHIFYPGLFRVLQPFYRNSFAWMESAIVSSASFLALAAQGFYRIRNAPAVMLVTVVLLLTWVVLQ